MKTENAEIILDHRTRSMFFSVTEFTISSSGTVHVYQTDLLAAINLLVLNRVCTQRQSHSSAEQFTRVCVGGGGGGGRRDRGYKLGQ